MLPIFSLFRKFCFKGACIPIFSLAIILAGCHKPSGFSKTIRVNDACFKGVIKVEKIEELNKYCISIRNLKNSTSDRIYTPYEVFYMETGELNGDGKTDICIGIIKPTPFDPVYRKRLFIFQIDRDYIRPLWLSSRLVQPLEEFRIGRKSKDRQFIFTIEKDKAASFCIHQYQWESFGMSYLGDYGQKLSYNKAKRTLIRLTQK